MFGTSHRGEAVDAEEPNSPPSSRSAAVTRRGGAQRSTPERSGGVDGRGSGGTLARAADGLPVFAGAPWAPTVRDISLPWGISRENAAEPCGPMHGEGRGADGADRCTLTSASQSPGRHHSERYDAAARNRA